MYVCVYVCVYLNHFAQQKLIQRCKSATVKKEGDFPAHPVVKTLCFHCRGHGFEPWWGTRSHMPSTAKEEKKKKKELPKPRLSKGLMITFNCICQLLAFENINSCHDQKHDGT